MGHPSKCSAQRDSTAFPVRPSRAPTSTDGPGVSHLLQRRLLLSTSQEAKEHRKEAACRSGFRV